VGADRRSRPRFAAALAPMNSVSSARLARIWSGTLVRHVIALAVALLVTLLSAQTPRAGSSPAVAPAHGPWDVYISAGDSWWLGNKWLPIDSPGSIRDSVRMWSEVLNLKRVYWRGQQEEMMIDFGLIRKENLVYHEFFEVWERHLMKDLHLNQVLVTEAHQRGMEVHLWAPLFDFGGPADSGGTKEYPYYGQLNLTIAHPEWMPVDRYGIRAQNGPIELAYPEARKALIEMYLHYIDRDQLDGITFFTFAENYGLRFEDEFGYNQPVVDEYKRRYGVDIRTQEFDKHLWRYLRGEYVTQFLRELKTALQARGKRLGVRLNPREPNYTDRWNVPQYLLTAGRIYLDWERWVREGIVDDILIGGNAPTELRERTFRNALQLTRGTPITVSALTSNPTLPHFQPYTDQGMRLHIFATDDASYIKLVYPKQEAAVLQGRDIYAMIRFLAQVAEGEVTLDAAQILPLVKHENILVRRQAIRALGRLKDTRSVPVLEAALDDPERSVRAAAVFALAEAPGPESVAKLIDIVRRVREFQIFEAVSSALTAIDARHLPQILALADDPDVVMRRMGLYVLGGRGDRRALPALVKALDDADLYVRFRAAHGLQAFRNDPQAIEALYHALADADVVIQNRAAVSLAIALVEGCTVKPRYGLESAISILETPAGALREIRLNAAQERGLAALAAKFREFGDASKRSDLEWGFRPVGNAILAFGVEGGRRLQQMIDQKADRRLAELAWQVLNIRQGMENFCPVPGADEENARIYSTYPTKVLPTKESPSPLPYDPTNKDK
jgi:HEAT repeat protein